MERVLAGPIAATQRQEERSASSTAAAQAWPSATDAQLAEALRGGDAGAQREAWRRFLPVVRGMARRRLGRGGDVDDVVQDTFLALFGSIRLLREPIALRAFSLTITARILNREMLRRARTGAHAGAGDVEAEEWAQDEADPATRHAYAVLRMLVARLRMRERRALVLRFVAGMTAPEVAGALGVSIPTVRRVLSTAQKRIEVWASRDPFLADYLDGGPTQDPGFSPPAS